MKYLVAIMLPEEVADQINRLQQRYKPERWNIRVAPHITLVHRGDLTTDEEWLKHLLTKVAGASTSFPVTVAGVGCFNNEQKTIYAKVDRTPQLMELQQSIANTVDNVIKSNDNYTKATNYTPHITLSNRLTEREFTLIYPEVQAETIYYSFNCTQITLLKRAPAMLLWREVAFFNFRSV